MRKPKPTLSPVIYWFPIELLQNGTIHLQDNQPVLLYNQVGNNTSNVVIRSGYARTRLLFCTDNTKSNEEHILLFGVYENRMP